MTPFCLRQAAAERELLELLEDRALRTRALRDLRPTFNKETTLSMYYTTNLHLDGPSWGGSRSWGRGPGIHPRRHPCTMACTATTGATACTTTGATSGTTPCTTPGTTHPPGLPGATSRKRGAAQSKQRHTTNQLLVNRRQS